MLPILLSFSMKLSLFTCTLAACSGSPLQCSTFSSIIWCTRFEFWPREISVEAHTSIVDSSGGDHCHNNRNIYPTQVYSFARCFIKVKVCIQILIATSFSTLLWERCRDEALCNFISSLPCLHSFWHTIPTFLVLYVCIYVCVYVYLSHFNVFVQICHSCWVYTLHEWLKEDP